MTAKRSKKMRSSGRTDATTGEATAAQPRPKATPRSEPASSAASIIGPQQSHADKLGRYGRRTRWLVFGAIALAWVLGFGMRAAWLSSAEAMPNSSFEGHRLLTTADAYYYASGVKNEVDGSLAANPRVPDSEENILVLLTSTVVKVLGLPVEAVCQWMPAFLAPLVAIPLVLLGLALGQLAWGFLTSLVVVLGFSYWNRTVPGYFDTDMVSITYILAVVTLTISAFWRRRTWFGTVAGLLAVAAPYMHPGSERVLAAIVLGAFGYAVVFARREPYAYRIALALLIAFLPIPFWLRCLLIGALELGLSRVRLPLWPLVVATVATLFVVLWQSRSMDMVLGIVGIRFGGGGHMQGLGIQFPGLGETVAELANPTLKALGERVSGHPALVISGVIGYLLACWRFRPLLLLAPLLALGTVLAVGGQRYTIFAVPVVALGNIWLMTLSARLVARGFPRRPQVAELTAAAVLSMLAIGPAIAHSLDYPPRTALGTNEAMQLNALSKRVSPGDFMISWWDYAYGAWYHAGVTTLVDGTKQNVDVWIASEVLFTSSQREAAALSRLAVEEQVKHPPLTDIIGDVIRKWTTESGQPASDFVPALREGRVPLPAPTRQIFFYIPWRIVQIVPNVAKARFAKGLLPEAELNQIPFLVVNQLRPDGTPVTRTGWVFDSAQKQLVGPRGERIKVYKVTDVVTEGGRVRSRDTELEAEGRACIVNIKHVGMTLYMDRALYESVLSQLLFLVRPDPALFEAVSYSQGGVIYRVLP